MASYTVVYHPDLHILFLRWLRPNTFAESQDSYAAALAERHACTRWLLDGRRTGPIEVAETNWLANDFFPDAAARFAPHPLHLAVLSSPARVEQVRTDPAVGPHVARALSTERPYRARVFTEEGPAVEWLATPPA